VRTSEHRAWEDATDRARGNAFPAAIAALCLLYFGFFGGYVQPTVTDLFSLGNLIFFYCLRIGGVAMALIAAVSAAGAPVVLVCDAVVSVAIGALFVTSAGMMLIDGGGGLNPFLMIVFGALFISAGVRNGRAFMAIRCAAADYGARAGGNPARMSGMHADAPRRERAAPAAAADASPALPSDSLASRLLERSRDAERTAGRPKEPESPDATPPPRAAGGSARPAAAQPPAVPADAPPRSSPPAPSMGSAAAPAEALDPANAAPPASPPPDPPEGGFLAAFAPRKDDGPR